MNDKEIYGLFIPGTVWYGKVPHNDDNGYENRSCVAVNIRIDQGENKKLVLTLAEVLKITHSPSTKDFERIRIYDEGAAGITRLASNDERPSYVEVNALRYIRDHEALKHLQYIGELTREDYTAVREACIKHDIDMPPYDERFYY